MVKFMMKSLLLSVVLLFGVLLGMQTAQQGLIKMKGYDDPSIEQVFTVSKTGEGEVEADVMGNKRVVDLEEKQKLLEERKAFNFFSSIGKSLANSIQAVIQKAVEAFHNLFV
ncbi:hypothetical protein CHN50_07055 [Priestia aryabhattai]|uniref:DUF3679 domain-containing protein n=1 Tax=Bacillaceae TaxID=186817 RepID=UPI000BA0474D|nr:MULTISPECIES: DUF3679 domain-containing protein [Bacillaceae]MDT2045405.1 DUF3679 domain-containing protein [Priestia flexa]OZT13529.1 hypothetical protein CHN50_07055 [Priestia aryabhattai]TDB50838.1 DUF3679 domain-containing protein [Bacillus sp. CBEL-1]